MATAGVAGGDGCKEIPRIKTVRAYVVWRVSLSCLYVRPSTVARMRLPSCRCKPRTRATRAPTATMWPTRTGSTATQPQVRRPSVVVQLAEHFTKTTVLSD